MAIIGIDLGTSNSAAAVLRGGRPVIIPSAEGVCLGGKAFPSYVAITGDSQTLAGVPTSSQFADKRLNNADSICYEAEKTLADYGDKISDDLQKHINTAVGETREAIKKKDAPLATERGDKLKDALQEAACARSEGQEAEAQPADTGSRGKVVDAEFHETKA